MVAALTDIGGRIFIVPLLTLLYGLEPVAAVGTSFATIIIHLAGFLGELFEAETHPCKVWTCFGTRHNPGGICGRCYYDYPPNEDVWLGLIFGVFLIPVAFQTAHKALKAEPMKASATFQKLKADAPGAFSKLSWRSFLWTFGNRRRGCPSSSHVPCAWFSNSLCNPHPHVHHGFHVISGVVNHMQQGNVQTLYAVCFGLGAVAGAQLEPTQVGNCQAEA